MDQDEITTVVGAIVAVVALISVALRFYSRYTTKAGFGWDDWLILIALSAIVLTDILVLYASSVNPKGAEVASNIDPTHVYTPEDVLFTKLNYIASVLYFTITSATKLSILLMYNRLFSADASFRHQVIVAAVIVVSFWVGTTVADLLNCIPMEYTWINSHDDPRYCFNYTAFWMASGIVEALIDVVIIVMPIRVVVGLQMNRGKKIAVAGVFMLGIFVIISGIVKVILSYQPGNREPSFGGTEVWTTVHCCTGIVCACLPVCWPLVRRLMKHSPSPGSWPAVSSLRKRWYSFSGWSSMERGSAQRSSSLPEPGGGGINPAAVEYYELPRYSPDAGSFTVTVEDHGEQRPIGCDKSHHASSAVSGPRDWVPGRSDSH